MILAVALVVVVVYVLLMRLHVKYKMVQHLILHRVYAMAYSAPRTKDWFVISMLKHHRTIVALGLLHVQTLTTESVILEFAYARVIPLST